MSFKTPSRKGKSSLSQAPSTTPQAPPPTWLTQKSTTPAGNPPSSSKLYGSSYNFGSSTFSHQKTSARGTRGFAVPDSSPMGGVDDGDSDAEQNDADYDMDIMDVGMLDRGGIPEECLLGLSGMGASPRGLKRSRNGHVKENEKPAFAEIARAMADNGDAAVVDADDVVLGSETIVRGLHEVLNGLAPGDPAAQAEITNVGARLSQLWRRNDTPETQPLGIGPKSDSALDRASWLSSLLLQLHQPHTTRSRAPQSNARQLSLARRIKDPSPIVPLPQALLEWLNTYHTPYADDFDHVFAFKPSAAASESFWDVLYTELLRGRIDRVVFLLERAGWGHAATALNDGSNESGYVGQQLENTQWVVEQCIELLESCPGLQDEDWDVRGPQWQQFRQQARFAGENLKAFAHASFDDDDEMLNETPSLNAFAHTDTSMSASTARAGIRVPKSIFDNLLLIYVLVQGQRRAIVDTSQDWVEASLLLTVWWDGEDEDSAAFSRRKTREVDVAPAAAYAKQLQSSFGYVLEQDDACFHPQTTDVFQVGLACVMEDNIDGAIGIIRSMSLSVCVGLVELATRSGWLPGSTLSQAGFSTQDLLVLSHGPGSNGFGPDELNLDGLLCEYAELLAGHAPLRSADGSEEREGWDLAITVLGRLSDRDAAQRNIASLIDSMPLDSQSRVDKALEVCGQLGLVEQSRAIAERYADSLTDATESSTGGQSGLALIYYARAHACNKLQSSVTLLIHFCLLQSAAVPTRANMDEQLASLISKKRGALVSLAHIDPEAANLLSSYLYGYASVRRFYELRDQDLVSAPPTTLRPLQRTRAACKALMAVIRSADDCIAGGLRDPEIESRSVIPVDGLLALLSEALPLLGYGKRILTRDEVFFLLRVVEDLERVGGRVREGATAFVQASLKAYRGAALSRPQIMTRSRSALASERDSITGSWDTLAELSQSQLLPSRKGEGEVHRAWDWRKGLDAVAGHEVKFAEVTSMVRAALAQEVARGWAGVVKW